MIRDGVRGWWTSRRHPRLLLVALVGEVLAWALWLTEWHL